MTTQEGLPALATDDEIAELRAGLEGVTDGPWEANHSPDRHHTDVVYGRYQSGARDDICLVGASELDEQNANAAHIARLSPDRIRAVLARLEAAERTIAENTDGFWYKRQAAISLAVQEAEKRAATAERQVKELREALNSLTDDDVTYDGSRIVIECEQHYRAIERMRTARAALEAKSHDD